MNLLVNKKQFCPYRLRWLNHRAFNAEYSDRRRVGAPIFFSGCELAAILPVSETGNRGFESHHPDHNMVNK